MTAETPARDFTGYLIVDTKTGIVIAKYTYAKRNVARNRAERLNQSYGAHRYSCHPTFG